MELNFSKFELFPAEISIAQGKEELNCSGGNDDLLESINSAVVNLKIQQSEDEYFCQGKLRATAVLCCARCLEKMEKQIESDIDFIACSKFERQKAENQAVDSEEYIFFDKSLTTINIADLVFQTVLLSVSMKPLCKDDCQGLCGSCGINLNEKTCNCNRKSVDPRWEGLNLSAGK